MESNTAGESLINKNCLYFRQAANMLGEHEALRHLELVTNVQCGFSGLYGPMPEKFGLNSAFQWGHTPQGYDFWCVIFDKALKDGVE